MNCNRTIREKDKIIEDLRKSNQHLRDLLAGLFDSFDMILPDEVKKIEQKPKAKMKVLRSS